VVIFDFCFAVEIQVGDATKTSNAKHLLRGDATNSDAEVDMKQRGRVTRAQTAQCQLTNRKGQIAMTGHIVIWRMAMLGTAGLTKQQATL